jgi:hypothetical protein
MSAGFAVADEVFWGTNGAVEAYVDCLAALAADQLGPDHPLATFFREQQVGCFPGRVVFLDEVLAAPVARRQFVELLDMATVRLLEDGAFTEYGQAWVSSVVTALRARVAGP